MSQIHIMLDFETLGQKPDTAVLSLGMTAFDKNTIHIKKEWLFSLGGQLAIGRTITPDTLLWWMNQGDKAKALFQRVQKEGILVRDWAPEFCKTVADISKKPKVWSNGAGFDVPILESLLYRCGMEPPYKFWDIRCYRTIKALFGIEENLKREGTHHNALDDAIFQTQAIQRWLTDHPHFDG